MPTRRPVRSFRPSVEALEDRLVPAFTWPTNLSWPDLAAVGTQLERTYLRRDARQVADVGSDRYEVTLSAGINWQKEYTLADGTAATSKLMGWYSARLTKYDGGGVPVDSQLKYGGPGAEMSTEALYSLVVGVGTPPAGFDLAGFSVVDDGWSRRSFEDSYLGYTLGSHNTEPLSYQYAGGASGAIKVTSVATAIIPTWDQKFVTTTEQQSDSAYWASSDAWSGYTRKGRLAVESGASNKSAETQTDTPWVVDGVGLGRQVVVDGTSGGTSWTRSSGYSPYSTKLPAAPTWQEGWTATQHDESDVGEGTYHSEYRFADGATGWTLDSGDSTTSSKRTTMVALDKTETRDDFFLTLTPPSSDPSTHERTAAGYSTSSVTLTGGKYTVDVAGSTAYAGGKTVADRWVVRTTDADTQEILSSDQTTFHEATGNPVATNLRDSTDLTVQSQGSWKRWSNQGSSTDRDLVLGTTLFSEQSGSELIFGLSSSGSGKKQVRLQPDVPLLVVTTSESSSGRAGRVTEFSVLDGSDGPAGQSLVTVAGSSASKVTGSDFLTNVLTHPLRPTRTDTVMVTVRRDDTTQDTNLTVADCKIDAGTVRVAADQTGYESRSTAVDGIFQTVGGKYLGSEKGNYNWHADTTAGHRERTTTYAAGVATEQTAVADAFDGGFSLSWNGSYSESPTATQTWSQNGGGTFSGKTTGDWQAADGKLTAGSLTVSAGDHRAVTSKIGSRRDWLTETTKGWAEAGQKRGATNDNDDEYTFGVVGGVWVESGRTYDRRQLVVVDETYKARDERTEPGSYSYDYAEATGTRSDESKAKGTGASGTFSREHVEASDRGSNGTNDYSYPSGDWGKTTFGGMAKTKYTHYVSGTTTNGVESASTFLNQSSGAQTSFYVSNSGTPAGTRRVETNSKLDYLFERVGSPASGRLTKYHNGTYSRNTQYTPTGGSVQVENYTMPIGMYPVAQETTWPGQLSWWSDTWVVAAWNLLGESWVGQGASWVWNNGHDLLRVGIGLIEVGLGAGATLATGATGGGIFLGVALAGMGVDQILTGYNNIRSGRIGRGYSVAEWGVYRITGSNTAAVLVPAAASLGLSIWAGRVLNAGQGTTSTLSGRAYHLEDAMEGSQLIRAGVGSLTAAQRAEAGVSAGWWTILWLKLRGTYGMRVNPAVVGEVTISHYPVELFRRMIDITAKTNREVALFQGLNGRYYLVLGPDAGSVSFRGAGRVIAHTHPNGNLILSFRREGPVSDLGGLATLRARVAAPYHPNPPPAAVVAPYDFTFVLGPSGHMATWVSRSGGWVEPGIELVSDLLWNVTRIGRNFR